MKSNFLEMIFGEKVVGQFSQYLAYVGEARSYANKLKSDDMKLILIPP